MDPANNLRRDEARERAALLSGIAYEVALGVTDGDERFSCEATVSFRCAEAGASTFLDFCAPSVERMELNGKALDPDAFDGSRIHLPSLAESNKVKVTGICSYEHTGAGLHFFRDPVDGDVYLHTQFEPFDAHRVYPCFDQPDLKATLSLAVTAPEGWQVVSNSRGVVDGGRWVFDTTPLMSTYITAVVAGPYHVIRERHGHIDLGLYCRKTLAEHIDPDEIFEITRQGLDFYEASFGYPYPFSKYDQLFVPEFAAGAMENAGCVTFHENFIFRSKVTEAARERRAEVILHEMAHMWFGDLVTMKWWDDLWLNESFATFMSVLSQVSATRFQNAWTTFADTFKSSARRQDQLPTTHPIAADIPDVESVHLNFDAITYEKGASVLRQLVAWVGQDAFLDGLKGYFRQFEFANADLRDFLRALEEASGRDLAAWSREWLETAGLNTIRPIVEIRDGRYEMFAVQQEAEASQPTLRSHRLAVGLYDLSGDELKARTSVELDVEGARTEVTDLVAQPVSDLVLVNDRDLSYAKIRLDEHSLATITDHLHRLSDPLARTLCWGALWDMVRDAELPARRYLRLVARNIHGETDIGVVQTLLDQTAASVDAYGDPGNAAEARAFAAERAQAGLESSSPGSDFQLAWARAWFALVRDPSDLAIIRGLLEGDVPFEGLVVDTDLRWGIVTALAAAGAAGTDLVEAEVERDPTDIGRRHAATANAAMPTADAKAHAWAKVVEDTDMPLATMRAMMLGFQRADQAELLAPYAARYFDTVGAVWKERDIDTAIQFARAMYPRVVIGDDVLAMTDEHLESADPSGPVRRILIEGHDQMARAIRARARDAAST